MTGTVLPTANHNPKEDAEKLRKAMKGLGTNEKELIEVIANRTSHELQKVALEFKSLYGRDLIEDVISETSGNFRKALVGHLQGPALYDAENLKNAIEGLGTDEVALVEILATRNNEELKAIAHEYRNLTGRPLEKDIIGDTSGDFKRLLVALSTGNREENAHPDLAEVDKDAKAFYDAGEGRWGTDEEKFIQIISSRSWAHIRLMAEEYHKISKRSLIQAIESETSGWFRETLKTVVHVALDRPDYFAERLHHAMKGLGTDDRSLVRIVVSRCQVDMVEIKETFLRKYGKSLESWIADDTSGDYKSVLLHLIR